MYIEHQDITVHQHLDAMGLINIMIQWVKLVLTNNLNIYENN